MKRKKSSPLRLYENWKRQQPEEKEKIPSIMIWWCDVRWPAYWWWAICTLAGWNDMMINDRYEESKCTMLMSVDEGIWAKSTLCAISSTSRIPISLSFLFAHLQNIFFSFPQSEATHCYAEKWYPRREILLMYKWRNLSEMRKKCEIREHEET